MHTQTHAVYMYFLVSAVKIENVIGKNDIFYIFAQNIDCGYMYSPKFEKLHTPSVTTCI